MKFTVQGRCHILLEEDWGEKSWMSREGKTYYMLEAEFWLPVADEACQALFWPTLGFKQGIFNNCKFQEEETNFCIYSMPPAPPPLPGGGGEELILEILHTLNLPPVSVTDLKAIRWTFSLKQWVSLNTHTLPFATARKWISPPVSYTHLTLPTTASV